MIAAEPLALPLIDAPPFWRAATAEEIAEIIAWFADDPAIASRGTQGWTLGFFSFLVKDARWPAWGWIKGDFAISECFRDSALPDIPLTRLTHLPTGKACAAFTKRQAAAFAATKFARALDWSDPTPEAMEAQAGIVLDVLKTHFLPVAQLSGDGVLWTRAPTLHQDEEAN